MVKGFMCLSIFAFIAGLLLAGCASTPSPIDRLVADLSSTHGMWRNGYFFEAHLPKTATAEQIVKEYFKVMPFEQGKVSSYKILRAHQVNVPESVKDEIYTAVLVETTFDEKIVLFRFENGGWWSRAYDANKTYYQKINMHDTPLHDAVRELNKEKVKALLANKTDVNAKNDQGWTPLRWAAFIGDKDLVAILHAANANANIADHFGVTPLHAAAVFGHLEVVKLLVANNADLNAKNSNGETPLQTAVDGIGTLFKEAAEFLLASNADPNTRNNSGETPLHNAARSGKTDLINLLLAYKADVNATNNVGETPLYFADGLNHKEAADLLRQHGGHE
jgi:ankyrin repeat protein